MTLTKKDFTKQLALRINSTEKEAEKWVDAYTETLIDIFKTGNGVTINGLGGFYIGHHSNSTAFKFNPSQRIKAILGWSSTYKEKK